MHSLISSMFWYDRTNIVLQPVFNLSSMHSSWKASPGSPAFCSCVKWLFQPSRFLLLHQFAEDLLCLVHVSWMSDLGSVTGKSSMIIGFEGKICSDFLHFGVVKVWETTPLHNLKTLIDGCGWNCFVSCLDGRLRVLGAQRISPVSVTAFLVNNRTMFVMSTFFDSPCRAHLASILPPNIYFQQLLKRCFPGCSAIIRQMPISMTRKTES